MTLMGNVITFFTLFGGIVDVAILNDLASNDSKHFSHPLSFLVAVDVWMVATATFTFPCAAARTPSRKRTA